MVVWDDDALAVAVMVAAVTVVLVVAAVVVMVMVFVVVDHAVAVDAEEVLSHSDWMLP